MVWSTKEILHPGGGEHPSIPVVGYITLQEK